MRAKREVVSAVAERYRAAGRSAKGRILDELCSVTGWHRKHAIRVLSPREKSVSAQQRQRHRTYGPSIRDALIAVWEASDRLCGKKLCADERPLVSRVSAATIDRLLGEVKIAAAGVGAPAPAFPQPYASRFRCARLMTGGNFRRAIVE